MDMVTINGVTFAVYGEGDDLPEAVPRLAGANKSPQRLAIESLEVGQSVAISLTGDLKVSNVRGAANSAAQALDRRFKTYTPLAGGAVVVTRVR